MEKKWTHINAIQSYQVNVMVIQVATVFKNINIRYRLMARPNTSLE